MTNYKSGYNIERKAIEELRNSGYYTVRSGGSKGIWDIVGIGPENFILIQAKKMKVKKGSFIGVTKEEIDVLRKFKVPHNCKKYIWLWRNREGWDKIRVE